LFQPVDIVQHLLLEPDHSGARLPQTAILLGEATDGGALVHAQRAHAGSAAFTPGKHGGGMEPAVRLSTVTTGVAAARLDLIDRAFDQFTDLKNLPQLAAILCRQVAKDLSLAGGGIGNRHGRTHAFESLNTSRKANSVARHFHSTGFSY
jgi:hypothetical protein